MRQQVVSSSTHRRPSPRKNIPTQESRRNSLQEPPPSKDVGAINGLMSCFEALFSKLDKSLEAQNTRLMSIENALTTVLGGKLDALISTTSKVGEALVGVTESNSLILRRYSESTATSIQLLKPFDYHPIVNLETQSRPATSSVVSRASEHTRRQRQPVVVDSGDYSSIRQYPQRKVPDSDKLVEVSTQKQLQGQLRLQSSSHLQIVPPKFLQEQRSVELLKQIRTDHLNMPLQPSSPSFTANLKRLIGSFTSDITNRMYKEYTTEHLLHNELKSKFAWYIMQFWMGFDRALALNCQQNGVKLHINTRIEIFATMDRTMRKSLEFLIKKYPPSKHKIVDTSLARHIVEVKRHTDTNYDILRNAGVSFVDDNGRADFSRDIKLWLNRLVTEVKRVFPIFKDRMKELFNGNETSMADDNEVQYEIGSKISETTELYNEEELNAPGLPIKSPQILRVLVKWIEEMRKNLFTAKQQIPQNKCGFKSKTDSAAINLTTGRKLQLATRLQNLAATRLFQLRKKRERHLMTYISQVLLLASTGVDGHEELPSHELLMLRAAECLSQCSNTYTLLFLNTTFEYLNLVRKLYQPDEPESNIDLITFNVLDILRCKCVGSKNDIKRIYNQLVASDEFEVIRVKNKLNESTRDILINFKPKQSFLVCQMQLSLGSSSDETNDHFCHLLYELQRSLFPVLFEVGSQIVSYDPRVAYFSSGANRVSFRKNPQSTETFKRCVQLRNGRLYCSSNHQPAEMTFEKNNVPFCCGLCWSFVSVFKFGVEFAKCPECLNCACPKCLIGVDKGVEEVYLRRQLNWQRLGVFMLEEASYLSMFCTDKAVFAKLNELLGKHPYVLLYKFSGVEVKVNLLKKFKDRTIESLFTISGVEVVLNNDKDEHWNVLVVLQPAIQYSLNEIKSYVKVLADDRSWSQLEQHLDQRHCKVLGVKDTYTKQLLVVDIVDRPEDIEKKLNYEDLKKYVAKESRGIESTLEMTGKELTNLEVLSSVRNPLNLRSLNLWGNMLTKFTQLTPFANITEIILQDNRVQSLAGLLQLQKLQHLNLNKNCLTGELPAMNMPQLELLDLSANQLTSVNSLKGKRAKLRYLRLAKNKLTELPELNCPDLELLTFSSNGITSLETFSRSNLPELKKVLGNSNNIKGALPAMKFPELEWLELEDNSISSIDKLSSSDLPLFEHISLFKNSVGQLPAALKLPKLRSIIMKNNSIKSLEPLTTWVLPCLSLLDISSNSICTQVPTLAGLLALKSLQLSQNSIQSAEGLTISRLLLIEQINISKNMLKTIPLLALPLLKSLDLSHNKIESARLFEDCRLPQLHTLLLNDNCLRTSMPVLNMPKLAEINIDRNDVTDLECLRERQLIPCIKTVSFKDNKKLAKKGDCLVLTEGEMYMYNSGFLVKETPK